MNEIKKVALIGLGAMGSFFAPRLSEHFGDKDFYVIADGKRKEGLEQEGITINDINHRFQVRTPQDSRETADLIIMAIKDTGLDQAIKDIKNFVGEQTQILCVMNGVESEEKVAAAYGWDHVLYSYMRISIVMKDRRTNFNPDGGYVHFGEGLNAEYSDRVKAIQDCFNKSNIPYKIEEDMVKGLWFKFMCNVGENLTCALLGVPFGVFRDSEYANEIRRAAMKEVILIAQKKGIDLGEEEFNTPEKYLPKIPYNNRPSTLQDLDNGRKTEVDMFAGTVIRMGRELKIATPVNWMFYNGIKLLEEKNEGMFLN